MRKRKASGSEGGSFPISNDENDYPSPWSLISGGTTLEKA